MPKLTMLNFARWHIWLGWLVGIPTLMWMVTGLYMAAKPIEEVRGNHLRVEQAVQPLVLPGSALASAEFPIREMRAVMQDGRAMAILTGMDGSAHAGSICKAGRPCPRCPPMMPG